MMIFDEKFKNNFKIEFEKFEVCRFQSSLEKPRLTEKMSNVLRLEPSK